MAPLVMHSRSLMMCTRLGFSGSVTLHDCLCILVSVFAFCLHFDLVALFRMCCLVPSSSTLACSLLAESIFVSTFVLMSPQRYFSQHGGKFFASSIFPIDHSHLGSPHYDDYFCACRALASFFILFLSSLVSCLFGFCPWPGPSLGAPVWFRQSLPFNSCFNTSSVSGPLFSRVSLLDCLKRLSSHVTWVSASRFRHRICFRGSRFRGSL
jgi:hypothetical protein